MANDDYREQHERDRAAGLAARHETRVERAIRRQVAEEIAEACERKASDVTHASRGLPMGDVWWTMTGVARGWNLASKLAREIGAKETS